MIPQDRIRESANDAKTAVRSLRSALHQLEEAVDANGGLPEGKAGDVISEARLKLSQAAGIARDVSDKLYNLANSIKAQQ